MLINNELRKYVRDIKVKRKDEETRSDHYLLLSKWNITKQPHETKKEKKLNERINAYN